MKQKLMIGFVASAVWMVLGPAPAAEAARRADTPPIPRLKAGWTAGPIRVDGRMDEPDWRRATRVFLKENQAGGRSVQRTSVRVLRDARYLYVAFDCADTQALATLTKRDDNLWREECVEIFFDPSGQGRRYLEIEVNPLGTLFDAWIIFGPDIDFDRAKKLDLQAVQVATRILRRGVDTPRDRGWTCEIAIPLAELPDPAGPGARINFARIDRINGKHVYDAWSPTYKWFHAPDRFGRIDLR